MARKKKHEEHENHERWLVSYADFITLLFAFFVVMYSVSSVNDGKYRVLSSSMVTAFHRPLKSLKPIQIGNPSKNISSRVILQSSKPITVEIPGIPGSRSGESEGSKEEIKKMEEDDRHDKRKKEGLRSSGLVMRKIGEDLEKALSSLIDQDLVSVSDNAQRVEVEIKSSVLFQSGSATISIDAIPVLEKVAGALSPFPNEVLVEGYTDNIPISNMIYPSNWELSAARSASVVHLFMKSGIKPERMTATGFAEYRPVAENDTEEGRSKNRRVVLVIPALEEAKAIVDALTGSGIGIGGREPKDGKDGTQMEEPLISNIILKRDRSPGMDFSLSEIMVSEETKSKTSEARALTEEDASGKAVPADDQAIENMMNEKPGVFPVTISPFQLPVLPSLKDLASKKSDVKDATGKPFTGKDVSQSAPEQSSSKPSLKGKVKTIRKAEKSKIMSDREIKLEKTTDISKEVSPQPIVPQSIDAQLDTKQGPQKNGGKSVEGAGRKGAFPILKLPIIPGLKNSAGQLKETPRPARSESQRDRTISKPDDRESSVVKDSQSQGSRKIILDRATVPDYETAPQDVTAPQPSGVLQQPGGATATEQEGASTQRQESRKDNQIPRIIAPPIKLHLRNIQSETDAVTQSPERQQ